MYSLHSASVLHGVEHLFSKGSSVDEEEKIVKTLDERGIGAWSGATIDADVLKVTLDIQESRMISRSSPSEVEK